MTISHGRVGQVSGAHTRGFHRRHGSSGHLWQRRFRSPVVQDDGHLWAVLRDIEANPLRAPMVDDPSHYPWSSYPAHGDGRPDPLLTALPEWSQLAEGAAGRRAEWRRRVTADQDVAELAAIRDSLRGGRPLGDPTWSQATAERLGLTPTEGCRPVGRPRNQN